MDYLHAVDLRRHISFTAFEAWRAKEGGRRLLLLSTRPGLRSLNVAVAAAMVLGEALRQVRQADPGTSRSLGTAVVRASP